MTTLTHPILEKLLSILDRKDHWAWPHIRDGRATRPQLLIHFQQEYEVFVRDFPILLGRVHSRCPHPRIRMGIAENLFEEETGKLTNGIPHPELFLEMMRGFGFSRDQFDRIELLPEAAAYRAWIDLATTRKSWVDGLAMVGIFIEGSVLDRSYLTGEISGSGDDPEKEVRASPWVKSYAIDPRFLDLKRVHQMVETDHRKVAWDAVLEHIRSTRAADRVHALLARTLDLWLLYRDGVARAGGILRPPISAGDKP